MIIELFGLPGVGKTYLCDSLSDQFFIPVIKQKNMLEKLFWVMKFGLFHPSSFFFLCKETLLQNGRTNRLLFHKFFHLLFEALANTEKAKTLKRGLVDYGLCQYFLSLYEVEVDKEKGTIYIGYLKCLLNKIFIVEAEELLRQKRMGDRGRRPRTFLGENYVRNWEQVCDINYLVFKKCLFEVEKIEVTIIKNN